MRALDARAKDVERCEKLVKKSDLQLRHSKNLLKLAREELERFKQESKENQP